MNYNKVILIGRLVKEPQTVMLPSGSQVSNLVIAYNRRYKAGDQEWKEETHFFEVKVFG
jgi:single stranded DNA-binding protein